MSKDKLNEEIEKWKAMLPQINKASFRSSQNITSMLEKCVDAKQDVAAKYADVTSKYHTKEGNIDRAKTRINDLLLGKDVSVVMYRSDDDDEYEIICHNMEPETFVEYEKKAKINDVDNHTKTIKIKDYIMAALKPSTNPPKGLTSTIDAKKGFVDLVAANLTDLGVFTNIESLEGEMKAVGILHRTIGEIIDACHVSKDLLMRADMA